MFRRQHSTLDSPDERIPDQYRCRQSDKQSPRGDRRRMWSNPRSGCGGQFSVAPEIPVTCTYANLRHINHRVITSSTLPGSAEEGSRSMRAL